MGLRTYRRKRDFLRTPEPPGAPRRHTTNRLYVIQKHAATRLHYDLRLEEGGVLKSWAVPKGPSLDPNQKRLAVQVEDHPIEYADFEGVIPEGQYGAGKVLVWDRGRWLPTQDPAKGLRQGKLTFQLEGEKLRGHWHLIRLHNQERDSEKPNWLLMKEQDEAARSGVKGDILQEKPESVMSGRRIEEIGESDPIWESNRKEHSIKSRASARPVQKTYAPPKAVQFQLATLMDRPPAGTAWLHEMKLDGFRLQCRIEAQHAELMTRRGQDWTHRFPTVAHAAVRLPVRSALLDGEIVALDSAGRSSFQLLQRALSEGQEPALVYYAFDLLSVDGNDLRTMPLESRKERLRSLLADTDIPPIRYSDHVVGNGAAFYQEACRLGLEGIVSKRRDAPYQSGRGRDWIKVKCLRRQEFVIGGFTEPSGSRIGLGALLLGVYADGRLVYAGRVGTGFNSRMLTDLRRKLDRLRQDRSPFAGRIAGGLRGVRWVKPELVAEVAFGEWTADDVLRHPSFQGLREDKNPQDVKREVPQPVAPEDAEDANAPRESHRSLTRRRSSPSGKGVNIAGIRLTNPTRVLYPELGLTKHDLARYYESVADRILPHIARRPLMILRCPEGHDKPCFHQKHTNDTVPKAVHAVAIEEDSGKKAPYLMVDDLPGLISLVQMGALELHVWGSRAERIENPDRMIFDLDPDTALPWSRVVEAAMLVKERLTKLGLESWVKTTGGKGLHVVVPLNGTLGWDEMKAFSQAVAESIAAASPDRYTSHMSKTRRKGKIFIDYLRNSRGATAVAAYSTRARPGAPVSLPVAWTELSRLRSEQFTVETVPRRLSASARDPWKNFLNARQSVTRAARRVLGLP